MRHVRALTLPRKAQFEPFLQFVGLISAIFSLISNVNQSFGTHFFEKQEET